MSATISPSLSARPRGGWRNSDGLASFHFRGISSYAPRDAFAVHICHAVPIDALVLSFQIEQCAVVPCQYCSRHMSGACQPIKVKSWERDDLRQDNGTALRWAHGADEFLYQILSAFDCHDFLWGYRTILPLIPRLQAHVKPFITDHNRIFPTNFAKFGGARLVS
jgi:hypothetical protein